MRRIGGYLFDERTGTLVDPADQRRLLRTQLRTLLRLFLDAPEHAVSEHAIRTALWGANADRKNNVHGVMYALKECFGAAGEEFFPRAIGGVYRLRMPVPVVPKLSYVTLSVEEVLDAQHTGRLSPVSFHPRSEVAVYARRPVELRRPSQLWTNLSAGVTYYFFFGCGSEHVAVELLHALYGVTTPARDEWARVMRNLRLRFLAGRHAPFELVLFNVQDHRDAVAYVRQPGEHDYRAQPQALDFWRWLDETPEVHQWHPLWAEPRVDGRALVALLHARAEGIPDLPSWAWHPFFDFVPRMQAARESSGALRRTRRG